MTKPTKPNNEYAKKLTKKQTKEMIYVIKNTPSPNKPNNDWEKEFDEEFKSLANEYCDPTNDVKDFISKTLQQQREKYEYTRKEIIEWLHEQNWKCEQLEKLLIQPKNETKKLLFNLYSSMVIFINYL